jgi:DNA-binding transcriptional LysR family regulator
METNRIRQFCAVAELESLRKAAELLGVSHGGLSKSLKVLEGELNLRLFVPAGRGLALTDQGRAFYARARRFLSSVDELLRPEEPRRPELRVATFEVFSTYFLSRVIARDLREHEVLVHELIPGKLEEAVLEGAAEVAITYEPIPRPGLSFTKVAALSMGVFGTERFRKARRVSELPFVAPITPIQGAPSGVRGLDGFPDDRVPRVIRYRVGMLQTALQLASQGVAVGFFPSFIARLYNETLLKEGRIHLLAGGELEKLKVTRPIFLVTRQSTPESREVRLLARHLRALQQE